ncbi:MAG: helix-turn-helix domain-containing protein [Eubacterium sp.]
MSNYVTGQTIKRLRESKGYTQLRLAEILSVSDKAVSKWETGKGLPDISLLEPLSVALGVSVAELFSGKPAINQNLSANMLKSKIYVCPICSNIIFSAGESFVSCCGVNLPVLDGEEHNNKHDIKAEIVDGEYLISVNHPMTKEHYISFISYVTTNCIETVKLYPESDALAHFRMKGRGRIYVYCNKDGLFYAKV